MLFLVKNTSSTNDLHLICKASKWISEYYYCYYHKRYSNNQIMMDKAESVFDLQTHAVLPKILCWNQDWSKSTRNCSPPRDQLQASERPLTFLWFCPGIQSKKPSSGSQKCTKYKGPKKKNGVKLASSSPTTSSSKPGSHYCQANKKLLFSVSQHYVAYKKCIVTSASVTQPV